MSVILESCEINAPPCNVSLTCILMKSSLGSRRIKEKKMKNEKKNKRDCVRNGIKNNGVHKAYVLYAVENLVY